MDVHSIDANLLNAIVRLVRLTDEPGSINVLAPLIVNEIIYRLVAGPSRQNEAAFGPAAVTQGSSIRAYSQAPLHVEAR